MASDIQRLNVSQLVKLEKALKPSKSSPYSFELQEPLSILIFTRSISVLLTINRLNRGLETFGRERGYTDQIHVRYRHNQPPVAIAIRLRNSRYLGHRLDISNLGGGLLFFPLASFVLHEREG